MMMPNISQARQVCRYRLGSYEAVLLDQIESVGMVEYLYILTVLSPGSGEPVLFVTAEVNAMAEMFGGGSHFLCTFNEQGHANRGTPEGITTLQNFAQMALGIAQEELGVTAPIEQLAVSD